MGSRKNSCDPNCQRIVKILLPAHSANLTVVVMTGTGRTGDNGSTRSCVNFCSGVGSAANGTLHFYYGGGGGEKSQPQPTGGAYVHGPRLIVRYDFYKAHGRG